MISLDFEDTELLRRLEVHTELSPAQIIQKLFPAHLKELHFYADWLDQLPERPTKAQSIGRFLLQSYGPESLIESVKTLDPNYQADSDKAN